MNDQLARSLFMDYLYDEITSEDKQRLETYLKTHPGVQAELDQLQQTRKLLQKMPAPEPAKQLVVTDTRERTFSQWWQQAKTVLPQTLWGRTSFAAAAVLILLFVIGSVTKVHFESTGSGFSVSLGYEPVINQGLSTQQANALVHQIQQENATMLANYTEALNQQNKKQLRQVVTYFEQQRLSDLQLIDQNLDQFQQTNNYRWQQANQFLGQVLQNVSLNEQK